MNDIVCSVKRVTDIMGEISAASLEQIEGIEQVNAAMAQMDGVTQKNATLVDQAAVATKALREEADQLEAVVSVFRLAHAGSDAAEATMPPRTVVSARGG